MRCAIKGSAKPHHVLGLIQGLARTSNDKSAGSATAKIWVLSATVSGPARPTRWWNTPPTSGQLLPMSLIALHPANQRW